MASVKIDLGSGAQAILSRPTGPGALTLKHRRDGEEFLRRWPRTRSVQQERGYLQQLGLHAGYLPAGVNASDASALLRSAVQSGRVAVVIERAAVGLGGSAGASQSAGRSGAVPSSRQSFAELAAGSGVTSAAFSDATAAPKAYSWTQRYDDVSADDLIGFIQNAIGGTSGDTADPAANLSTAFGDAEPFSLGADSASDDMMTLAARGVSEQDEGECYQEYERDMDLCHALGGPMGGARGLALCQQNAFAKYQQCRGF